MKLEKSLIIKIIFLLILLGTLFLSPPQNRLTSRLPIIIFIILLLSNIFYTTFVRKNNKNIISKVSLTIYTLAILFFIAETIFMFVPISHGVGYTLASNLWSNKYWKPINKFGFRDYEIYDTTINKKRIFVIGDSFVAGQGIKNIDSRFSNILQKNYIKISMCVI